MTIWKAEIGSLSLRNLRDINLYNLGLQKKDDYVSLRGPALWEMTISTYMQIFSIRFTNISNRLLIGPRWETRGLVCNDGSPAGYYAKLAADDAPEEAKNKWVIYLEVRNGNK